MADDDVIRTTGLELTVLEDQEAVMLTFSSRDREPIRLSLPFTVAAKLAQFITENLNAPESAADTPLH